MSFQEVIQKFVSKNQYSQIKSDMVEESSIIFSASEFEIFHSGLVKKLGLLTESQWDPDFPYISVFTNKKKDISYIQDSSGSDWLKVSFIGKKLLQSHFLIKKTDFEHAEKFYKELNLENLKFIVWNILDGSIRSYSFSYDFHLYWIIMKHLPLPDIARIISKLGYVESKHVKVRVIVEQVHSWRYQQELEIADSVPTKNVPEKVFKDFQNFVAKITFFYNGYSIFNSNLFHFCIRRPSISSIIAFDSQFAMLKSNDSK